MTQDLTPAEERLLQHALDGASLDLLPVGADPAAMAAWGPDQQIRASVLRDLLLGRLADAAIDPRGARLRGAVFVDQIDLDHCDITVPLQLVACRLDRGLTATDAHLRSLVLRGCQLAATNGPALHADRLTVDGDVVLNGGFTATGDSDRGAVRLRGARFGGQLNLRGGTLTNQSGPALHADRLTVGEGVFLSEGFTATGDSDRGTVLLLGARVGGQLNLSDGTLTSQSGPALTADGLTVDGDVFLHEGFTATGAGDLGAVRLLGARVGGQLNLSGGALTNQCGPALAADGLTVGESVVLNEGFTATGDSDRGTVLLLGARVGGQLNLSDGTLTNQCGPALTADGLTVDGDVVFDEGFTATGAGDLGAVRLLGARVGGHLGLRGGALTNQCGPALAADGLTVDGRVFLDQGFTATGAGELGAVRLLGARVGRQLSLRDGALTNQCGPALSADGLTVDGSVILDKGFTATGDGELGAVRLLGARVGGRFEVSSEVLQAASAGPGWVMDGLTYVGTPPVGAEAFTEFLQTGTLGYAAQPYQHLAGTCRAAGHDSEARRVLIAQRRDQTTRGDLGRLERSWAQFTGFTLGYGYQPWRAAIGLLGVLAAALILVFTVGGRDDVLGPATTTTTITGSPGEPAETRTVTAAGACTLFGRVSVAGDIAIPLIKAPTSDQCTIQTSVAGNWFSALATILRALAWATTVLFAAAFTSIIRKT